jgi:hypothetical protein
VTVFADPSWFFWAIESRVFLDRGGPLLQREAEGIWRKATNIKIPPRYPSRSQAAYYYQGWNHKFMDVKIVDDGRYEEHADIRSVLDLGYICDFGVRDRVGNNLLSRAIKRIVFGSKRVTVEMLEAFFADPANFDLPSSSDEAAE